MTKNIDKQKCFSLSQLRIQTEKLGGGLTKNQYRGENCLKKRRWCFWGGVDTLMHTIQTSSIISICDTCNVYFSIQLTSDWSKFPPGKTVIPSKKVNMKRKWKKQFPEGNKPCLKTHFRVWGNIWQIEAL